MAASALAQSLEADPSPFALRPPAGSSLLQDICLEVELAHIAAQNPSTRKKDEHAMRLFTMFCLTMNTPPWRTLSWQGDELATRRETVLLSYYLIWLTTMIKPRDKSRPAPLPQSCYNLVLAVRRAHAIRSFPMVPTRQIGLTLRALTSRYARVHGPESLLPNRKEPFEPRRIAEFRRLPRGTRLGSRVLDWNTPFFTMIYALFTVAGSTGFRKAEVCVPSGDAFTNMHLSRNHLWWRIRGLDTQFPSVAQLRSLQQGDFALIRPPPSKTDPFGTTFGNQFIYLPFVPLSVDPVNAAAALRDMELVFQIPHNLRRTVPLFVSDPASFLPLTHSMVDTVLQHFFHLVLPTGCASRYSFHSFRIGLACAMLAAGESSEVIQAHCRWRTDQSIRIYARPNADQFARRISMACTQRASSVVVANRLNDVPLDADANVALAARLANLVFNAAAI